MLFIVVFCVGEKKFDSVLLIDFAGTGIVIDGDNINARVLFFYDFHNSLAYDVIRKASEGLRTDDVVDAFVDMLDHFGHKKPSLAHFYTQADIGFNEFHRVGKRSGCFEIALLFDYVDYVFLLSFENLVCEL